MCTQNNGGDVVDDDEDDNDDDYDDDGVHLLQFPLPIGNIWVDIHVVYDDDYDDNYDENYDDGAHLKQLPLPIGNVVFQVDIFPKRFHVQLQQNAASHRSHVKLLQLKANSLISGLLSGHIDCGVLGAGTSWH